MKGEVFFPYYGRREPAGVHRAPKLYLGNTQLLTSKWVIRDDLSLMAHGLPIRGFLGIDCLRHYSIQLDFGEGKMRFLDPDRPADESLGKAFPLTFTDSP